MNQERIIRNCLHYIMKGIYDKLTKDGKQDKLVTYLGIYCDETLFRQRRVGWYAWIEVDEEDYGIAIALPKRILEIEKVEAMGRAFDMTFQMEKIFTSKEWHKIQVDEEFYELLKEEDDKCQCPKCGTLVDEYLLKETSTTPLSC